MQRGDLTLRPISFKEANAYVEALHRHHPRVQGWKYGISALLHGEVVGVIMVGRPVARMLDDGYTAEVTRCCTNGAEHVPSKLYAAAWRAARAMGYRRMITYTLASEPGTSLRAAGWVEKGQAGGGSWNRPNRARDDKHPLESKTRWEVVSLPDSV